MPFSKIQVNHIELINNIEEELRVLKEFTENKENESLSLLDLIGSEKSKKLLQETPTIQKILLSDEDLKIRQAIIDLFPEIKNKPLLIKSLDKAKEDFEKTDDKGKAKIISAHKKDLKIDYQTIYIYLRILYRRDSIANLAKFKQLIGQATNEDNKKIIVNRLQEKLSEMGSKDSINFNNLNTLPDWEQELKEIKQKLPIIKITSTKTPQSKSANIPITTSAVNPIETNSTVNNDASLLTTTSLQATTKQDEEMPLWQVIIEQKDQIDLLNEQYNNLEKDRNSLLKERSFLEQEVQGLEYSLNIYKKTYENELLTKQSRASVKKAFSNIKISGDITLSKENQDLKAARQKLNESLIEKANELAEVSKQKTESDKQLLEAQQVNENLERNIGEIQTKFNEQTEISESLSLGLESTKKLLEKSQNNLSQKDDELQKKAIQLQETEKRISKLKSLQSDLDATNENITQLSTEQNSLKAEIVNLQNQNQKLTSEWQESLNQKAALESKLKILNEIIQNDKSANQKAIDQYTQKSDELRIKHAKQENKIQELNKEIEEIISIFKDEKEDLNQKLKDAQVVSQNSELEINKLTRELNQLQINNSSNLERISNFTNQIAHLEELVLDKEKSIQELTAKMEIKENQIKDLNETLVETKEKSEQLENKNCDLEEQTIRQQQNIVHLANKETDLFSQNWRVNKRN